MRKIDTQIIHDSPTVLPSRVNLQVKLFCNQVFNLAGFMRVPQNSETQLNS